MKKQKSYSFEESLHKRIRIMAAELDMNLNDFINFVLDTLQREKENK